MTRQTPEGGVLRAVLDLLNAERIWHVRMNTGMLPVGRLDGRLRMVKFGRPGMADVLALARNCPQCGKRPNDAEEFDRCDFRPRPVLIECKAPRGRQSPAQRAFQVEVEAEGHTYLLIRDVSALQRLLKEAR